MAVTVVLFPIWPASEQMNNGTAHVVLTYYNWIVMAELILIADIKMSARTCRALVNVRCLNKRCLGTDHRLEARLI